MSEKINITVNIKKLLADTHTPVSIYLRIRDVFSGSILLESSDYHGGENSYSFICMKPIAGFRIQDNMLIKTFPETTVTEKTGNKLEVIDKLEDFIKSFRVNDSANAVVNGFFGYFSYDSVVFQEDIDFAHKPKKEYYIPEINYNLYKYIIAVNHFNNEMEIIENCLDGEETNISYIEDLLQYKNFAQYRFKPVSGETSNISDEEYKTMVTKGKESCRRGDVFQIVLSRQFSMKYKGDEFNVYRTLRSINPSPYLFFFDYGDFKLLGSSPEAQIVIKNRKVTLTPIAGSIKRTGNDEQDKKLAEKLAADKKENSEHVMLVDLARNDLSRNAEGVKVEVYREVQFYSHILHLVSKVTGMLKGNANEIKVMADCFPAGTLSGAPKYKAMQLIDKYENQNRGYYGGSIGYIGFNGDINQAILIRALLAKNNTLFYQAGAGIIIDSNEESELNEVNNKLQALKNAIKQAEAL